jgi:hypothetical protein
MSRKDRIEAMLKLAQQAGQPRASSADDQNYVSRGQFSPVLHIVLCSPRSDRRFDVRCELESQRCAVSTEDPHGEKRHQVQDDDAVFGSAVKGVAF